MNKALPWVAVVAVVGFYLWKQGKSATSTAKQNAAFAFRHANFGAAIQAASDRNAAKTGVALAEAAGGGIASQIAFNPAEVLTAPGPVG